MEMLCHYRYTVAGNVHDFFQMMSFYRHSSQVKFIYRTHLKTKVLYRKDDSYNQIKTPK